MQNSFSNILSERMKRIDSSAIRRAFDLALKLKEPINLSIGQPHFPTPPQIISALEKAVRDKKTAYTQTQGILELRTAMAQKFLEKNKFEVEPSSILVSGGLAALIELLFMACLDKGDKILLTDPCFLIYSSLANFFGAEIYRVPENFTSQELEALPPANFKLIITTSPSNPSGYILTKEQILLLGNLADKSGAILVSDEIYELYDYDKKFISPASLYPKTLTLSGFSKSYSMTGLRLGVAAGPKEIISAMTILQQYTIVCAPAPVQYAGIEALQTDMSEYIQAYKKNRDFCVSKLGNKLKFTFPSGAFYIFAEIPEVDDVFIERAIHEKNLILVPGSIFSLSKKFIRISYACEMNTLERGLQALLELL